MGIYFGFYFIVAAMSIISEKILIKTNMKLGIIGLIAIAFFMSVFAGMRDVTVGTDIEVYGFSTFRNCFYSTSVTEYLEIYTSDYLYYCVNWCISRITTDFQVYLFGLQLISSVLICKMAYDYMEECSITMLIITYLLFYYATSFNILRQSVAVMIVLCNAKHIGKKRYYLSVLIAYFFHASALVCMIIPVLNKIMKSKYAAYIFNAVIGVVIAVALNLENVVRYIPFISDKYLSYLSSGNSDMRLNYLIVKIIMLLSIYAFYAICKNKEKTRIFMILLLFDIIFYALSAKVAYIYRLSYYFGVHIILLIPLISKSMTKVQNKVFFDIVMICMLILHWIVRYQIIKYDGILPYVFY